ncbi:MAG: hypothetical protein WC656_04580 [Sulfurimonas sp.]|jgi:hypothetical protein
MSYGLERLKEIGAQKIHERTHIAKEHVQQLLSETFDSINRIHFIGFISILEREYDVDLSDLKAKGLEYYKNTVVAPKTMNHAVFNPDKKKNSNNLFYILLTFLLVGAFIYFELAPAMEESDSGQIINNTIIENAQKNIENTAKVDVNDTNNSNISDAIVVNNNIHDNNKMQTAIMETSKVEVPKMEVSKTEVHKTELQTETKTFKIIPRKKVWVGYYDLKTNQKNQQSTENEIVLDADKDWLIAFGHGYVNIEVNSQIKEFASNQKTRFKYVDGKLSEISQEEFKLLSKDTKW